MSSGRHRHRTSYGHHVQYIGPEHYRLFWTVDFYYRDSRLRHPRRFSRDTDRAGATRFAWRWGLPQP